MRLIFKHSPSVANPNSLLAHEAAVAAGVQGRFWEMHGLLFENQDKLARADLIGYARQLHLNVAVFEEALDNHTYRPVIERDLAEAKGLGVTTTPTLFINGRRLVGPQTYGSIHAVIDSLLAAPNNPSQQDILSSGAAAAINLDRAPTKGLATAQVGIIEFSDFECPFCSKSTSVIRQVLQAYPTQVRFAFKHYPLPMHREAALAHEAALAAGQQGKFWEMHDLLFATQDKLTREDLIEKARQLHLDVPLFTSDLDSHRFKAQVDADRQEGARLGVDGTPFFFVNGHALSGALTFAELKQVIDQELRTANAKEAGSGTK
jgi:protein-disulfide isomerase